MLLYRDFETREAIDRQYNLARHVADSQDWINGYTKESQETRQNLKCSLDVRYGPGRDETVDIFWADSKMRPVCVYFHGGYWYRGSSKDYSFVASGLVERGVTVIVVNYSLCPAVKVTDITSQSQLLITWLYHEGKRHGINTDNIFIAGHSAGGQQVAMLTNTNWDAFNVPHNVIKGSIPISGIFDLRPLRHSFLQPTLQLTEDDAIQQSPLLHKAVYKETPQLITFGDQETDEFQRQSLAYHQALKDKGCDVGLYVQKGEHHFSAIQGFANSKSECCQTVAAFIYNHCD